MSKTLWAMIVVVALSGVAAVMEVHTRQAMAAEAKATSGAAAQQAAPGTVGKVLAPARPAAAGVLIG